MEYLDLIPVKQISSNSTYPWISPTVKCLSRQKQRWYKKAKSSNSPEAWQRYRSLKKECQKQCHLAYHQYINNLTDSNSGKITKKLWSFIKSKRIDQCTIPPLQVDDITVTDSCPKAEAFNNYFKSVFTSEDTSFTPHIAGVSFPGMPPISISIEEVYHQLSNLQSNKASGPDKIPAYFFKKTASLIAPILFLIFQSSLNQGILPSDWKTANFIPIYKKGNRSQPNNYRLVSLTSICCKALERIIYSHVLHHLQAHGILCEEQHGFQTGKSCDSQIMITIHDFANCLNENKQIDAIFFDF